ncbi:MAG: aminoglycoside phosphotransferase family protein [Caldilineaceae bacterium]
MSKTNSQDIDVQQAHAFLASHLGAAPTDVVLVGEGAWSRCFGFRQGDQERVIRFGNHVDDFEKDQVAYWYHSAALPIPQVFEIGQAFGGYYAISTRAYGVPLESLNAAQWQATIPSLVGVLEALRTADLSTTTGLGGWGAAGDAPMRSWSEHLLAVGNDTPERRTYGWRKQLATWPEGEATFVWGFDLLKQVVSDAVPRCLLHCDLINRNVLVHEDKISGVFDWGCSLYGDHLYELAWFEFWSPWYPELDVVALRAALEQRWREIGYTPTDQAARLVTAYLHIGLDHLAYHAYIGDAENLLGTAARMRALVAGA